NARAARRRIVHPNVVVTGPHRQGRVKSWPGSRDAGVHAYEGAFSLYAQDAFDTRAIHPGGRPRVPGPPTAADMWRDRIDIRRDDVRLNFIALDVFGTAGVIARLHQGK